jgi:hypothetical protein
MTFPGIASSGFSAADRVWMAVVSRAVKSIGVFIE